MESDVDWNNSLDIGGKKLEGTAEEEWPSGMSLSEAPSPTSLAPGA